MNMWIYIVFLALSQGAVFGYSTIQIWSRDTGGWGEKDCGTTFVHYRFVQDVRLNHDLNEPCFCIFFPPDLDPNRNEGMEIVYRFYNGSYWVLWRRSPYSAFRNNSFGFAEFGVNTTGGLPPKVMFNEGNIEYSRDHIFRVNIQVENGDVYLLCSPSGFIDPRALVSTTTTTTEGPTTELPNTMSDSEEMSSSQEEQEGASESSSKKKEDNNNLYYTIAGVIAGLGVLAFIAIVIFVMCRKQKVVEKQAGFIPHIMRQKSTFSQAQTLYSHNTWKGSPFSGQETVEYDNDGIVAPHGSSSSKKDESSLQSKDGDHKSTEVHVHDLYGDREKVDTGSDVDSGLHGDTSLRDDSSSKKLVFHM